MPIKRCEQVQLPPLAVPGVLHLHHGAVVVQREPAAQLQRAGPVQHGGLNLALGAANDVQACGFDAQDQLYAFSRQGHVVDHAVGVDELFDVREPMGHGIDTLLRNRGRLGHESLGQDFLELVDMGRLLLPFHAGKRQPITQGVQQAWQGLQHLRPLLPRRLGARGPDQARRGLLVTLRFLGLDAEAHRGQGHDIGPGPEQEFTHLLAHRHIREHVAQLDRVLDRQRLLVLHLLGDRDDLRLVAGVGQVVGQEMLEFTQHQHEDFLPGLGILLNNLDDAPHLGFQLAAADAGRVEPHDAGAHAVDQRAGRMIEIAEEVGLGQRHPEHRYLRSGEPDADRRRHAVLRQNALEHQRHDLDDGLLVRRLGFLL